MKKIFLLLILVLAAVLRLYRLEDFMIFLGDEGRDALVVKRMIVDHKLTLLGPTTSVGNMYLGPIYYYMMAPFLWLFQLNPVGPAVMVALFGIATVFLLYKFSREFFNEKMAFIASLLYSVSPLTVFYSRSSWNPNIMPFFSLLAVYASTKAIVNKKPRWLMVIGLSLGIILQSHYLGSLMIFVIFLSLFLFRNKTKFKIKNYFLGILIFLLILSPFLAFNFRHDFVNIKAILRFLAQSQEMELAKTNRFLSIAAGIFWRLFYQLLGFENKIAAWLILAGTIAGSWFFLKNKNSEKKYSQFFLLLIWLIIGLGFLGFYHGIIYDYYFGYLYPLPFLLFGLGISEILKREKKWQKLIIWAFLGFLFISNLKKVPIWQEPNKQLKQTQEISRFVLEKTEEKPFNFALIAGNNSDYAYRYFFDIWKRPPITIENPQVDSQRKTVTEQLMVVCENPCSPLGHPLWEIAGFGRAEIAGQWSVSVVKVYKLIHYEP